MTEVKVCIRINAGSLAINVENTKLGAKRGRAVRKEKGCEVNTGPAAAVIILIGFGSFV